MYPKSITTNLCCHPMFTPFQYSVSYNDVCYIEIGLRHGDFIFVRVLSNNTQILSCICNLSLHPSNVNAILGVGLNGKGENSFVQICYVISK